jgi:hypothetical protein
MSISTNPILRKLAAYTSLRSALHAGRPLTDSEVEVILAAEPEPVFRKRMVSGLLGFGLVERDQAGMQVYLRPEMKDA